MVLLNLKSQSCSEGLGIKKFSLTPQISVPLRGLEDQSCSDDKPLREAHPILESSGAGRDILVSTLIAGPALYGTDP